ncbi:hypothetical protein TNIN_168971 [Trichonephila inaurata madagascariensis]|uniref:Uncharacterized protein n=1 Tax=Trichonephila inaurata madagascariensis TaxID=2747483 RepID=A0A8X7C179_9ARAC|nr:hypothetical protein TNIN_168971 [Trichonephila inaurata madagascariensis]
MGETPKGERAFIQALWTEYPKPKFRFGYKVWERHGAQFYHLDSIGSGFYGCFRRNGPIAYFGQTPFNFPRPMHWPKKTHGPCISHTLPFTTPDEKNPCPSADPPILEGSTPGVMEWENDY